MSVPRALLPTERKEHRKQMRRHKMQHMKEAVAKADIHAAKEAGLHSAADRKRAAVVAAALAKQNSGGGGKKKTKTKKKAGGKIAGVNGSKARGHAGAGEAAIKKMKRKQRAR